MSTAHQDQCVQLSFKGSPMEVGYAHGRAVKALLRKNNEQYIGGMARAGVLDVAKMRREAMTWFETVPARFREEEEGIARGAEIGLRDMVEWLYGSAYAAGGSAAARHQSQGCTSVVTSVEGRTWIAHNNDWHDFGSHQWTAAIVRHVDDRLPHLTFGLQGDASAIVGVNRERLWLNMNGFPARDARRHDAPVMPYVFLVREALETCRSLADVEALLQGCDRDVGMAVYAVDGKTEEAAVFECGLSTYVRRDPAPGHDKTLISWSRDPSVRDMPREAAPNAWIFGSNTRERIDRLKTLLVETPMTDLPADLIGILGDPEVEDAMGTVYSNVACPGRGLVWFGCGGLPAASAGTWHRIEWPFGQ